MNPYRLFGRVLVAILKVGALTVVFLTEVAISLSMGGKERIGDAVGELGRAVIDVFSEIWN